MSVRFSGRPRRLWSSFVSYIAAMGAMYVSMRLDLPRPWWVLMTVYVTTQPLAGVIRPKMTYRLTGVVAGAAASVFLVPRLVDAPAALSLCLAIWIGVCLYLATADRTPRAFLFMLAAYTAAIVGFPYLDQPADIFRVALDRVEEMSLGIVFATVAHTVLLPWDPSSAIEGRAHAFLGDARAWFADAFRGLHRFREHRERRRFAADLTELSIIAVHLPAEGLKGAVTRRLVGALQDQMSILLPLASAAEDRLDALRQHGAVTPEIAALVEDIIGWLGEAEPPQSRAAALRTRCRELSPDLGQGAAWEALLTASLCQRLSDFIEAYANSRALAGYLGDRGASIPASLARLLRRQRPWPLHRHDAVAVLAGLAGAAAILCYCATWILTGWPEGAATAAFAAMISCSFASQDDPAPDIVKYLGYSILAAPVAILYLFLILPAVDGFPALALVLAPALLIMGYVQADPGTAAHALPMLACFIVGMGFLQRYTGDYARFFNVFLAQIGGVIVTVGVARLFRSVGADFSAKRILRQGWREIAALAASSRSSDEIAWSHRMHDRLGLIAARMALADPEDELRQADALRDLRVGRNIIHLRRAQVAAASPALASRIQRLTDQIAAFYTTCVTRRGAVKPPLRLLELIDETISHFGEAAAGETRRHGFLALTGIRRNLFPGAAAYEAAAYEAEKAA
jgi:uncharacterized membrane protein YccC